jgi:hypothetical protein
MAAQAGRTVRAFGKQAMHGRDSDFNWGLNPWNFRRYRAFIPVKIGSI